MKDIIYFAHSRWNTIRKRPQQLALEVSKYYRFLYIEPPDNILAYLRSKSVSIKDIGSLKRKNDYNLYILHTYPTLPLKNYSKNVNLVCHRTVEFLVNKAIKYLKVKEPIYWFTLPSQYVDVGRFGPGKICYESMDEWWALSKNYKKSMTVEMERRFLLCADIVIASSKSLFEKCKIFNNNTIYIPNGADVGHFDKVLDNSFCATRKFEKYAHPIIGFIGAIDIRIDLDLIKEVALIRPVWSFIFLGPISRNVNIGRCPSNIHFLGPVAYDKLPGVIKAMDVCMMPYKQNEAVRNINPVKGYEFMAAGKPVVSTPFPDCDQWGSLLEIVRQPYEFVNAVEKMIIDNTQEQISERIEFAKENSWSERAKEIFYCFQSLK